jgi:hypothetical protein
MSNSFANLLFIPAEYKVSEALIIRIGEKIRNERIAYEFEV